MVKKISRQVVSKLIAEAKITQRKRKNLNYHTEFSDRINRMLNAIEPGSYIQPHKHQKPDKREVFLLLTGKLLVVFFDDAGKITGHSILDGTNEFGVEIPPEIWHTLIALESGTVVYEIKDGPYSAADDKNFAEWAPKEGDTNCSVYINKILSTLNIV